jgi:hypothetical protein
MMLTRHVGDGLIAPIAFLNKQSPNSGWNWGSIIQNIGKARGRRMCHANGW